MSNLVLNVVNIRYGVIEDNGMPWCKVATISDEIENVDGFAGQRLIEFSVDKTVAAQIPNQIRTKLPAEIEFKTSMQVKKGAPTLVIVGLV